MGIKPIIKAGRWTGETMANATSFGRSLDEALLRRDELAHRNKLVNSCANTTQNKTHKSICITADGMGGEEGGGGEGGGSEQ